MARHFLLIGDVGGAETYHAGDEAMLEANLIGLRELDPEARFTVISRDPAWTAAAYDVEAIAPIGFADRTVSRTLAERRLETILAAADGAALPRDFERRSETAAVIETVGVAAAVIVSGGGNLNDSWPQHLYERVALLELAALLDTPALVVGQTVGPRLTDPLRERLQAAARKARLFGVRERASYELMSSLGTPERILHRQLDDAFFLGKGMEPPTAVQELPRSYLAVTLCGEVAELPALAEQIERLAAVSGSEIVFIPHAAEPDRDRELGERFGAALRGEVEFHLLDVPMAAEAAALTRSAGLVVSMRYHPLVFAMSAGVPALAISVDDYTRSKQQGALAHAGMEDWVLPLEFACAGLLYPAGLELWERGKEIRAHLGQRLPSWEQHFEEHWRKVGRALGLVAAKKSVPKVEGGGEITPLPPRGGWHSSLRAGQRVTTALESRLSEAQRHAAELRGVVEARESEIAELEAVLDDRRGQADSLREQLEAQGGILQARQQEIESLNAELVAREEAVAAKQRELAATKEILAARDEETINFEPMLAARQEEIESLKALLVARQKTVDEAERELAAVREILAAREGEIANFEPTLTARQEEIESLETLLVARQETVEGAQRELAAVREILAARDQEIGVLGPTLAAREEELSSLKSVLATKDEELAELEATLDAGRQERDEARQELSRVRSRLLWRESQLDAYRRSLPGRLARGLGLVTDEDS